MNKLYKPFKVVFAESYEDNYFIVKIHERLSNGYETIRPIEYYNDSIRLFHNFDDANKKAKEYAENNNGFNFISNF